MKDLLKFRIKAFALIAILLLSVVGGLSAKKIAIIDAGSSGSRLYVYDVKEVDLTPGVTIDILYPNAADKELSKGPALSGVKDCQECVDCFLATMIGKYNGAVDQEIELYVLATAGMRNVNNGIYQKMQKDKKYGCFKLVNAMTISGRYEGLYAWIAANYRNRKLTWSENKWSLKDPYAILEIGGASMQIAYKVSDDVPSIRSPFGNIYSKSYLGGGVDQVYDKNKFEDIPDFGVQLDQNLIGLDLRNTTFVGLGRPIGIAFKNANGQTVENLNLFGTTQPELDFQDKYHQKMNARYIAYVLGKWGLGGKFTYPREDVVESDWTEGAAIAIVINNVDPESFNYPPDAPN